MVNEVGISIMPVTLVSVTVTLEVPLAAPEEAVISGGPGSCPRNSSSLSNGRHRHVAGGPEDIAGQGLGTAIVIGADRTHLQGSSLLDVGTLRSDGKAGQDWILEKARAADAHCEKHEDGTSREELKFALGAWHQYRTPDEPFGGSLRRA